MFSMLSEADVENTGYEEPHPESVRPEWLFEVVHRVQALAPAWTPPCVAYFHAVWRPASALEQRLLVQLMERAEAERDALAVYELKPSRPSEHVAARIFARERPRIAAAVVKARRLTEEQHARPWTVERLARRVGLNRTDLERGFRQVCSHSVHRYLTVCRIEAAKGLLRDEWWPLEHVAKAVGWRSDVSLRSNFLKIVGMTPERYRRRWRTWMRPNERVLALLSLPG